MENKDIITKTFEELADLPAYKKAGKDVCEWMKDSIWTHRTRGMSDIEIPTDERAYWTLGINPDLPFSKTALESMIKQEIENPRRETPHFTTIPELLAYIEWFNGWKVMQPIANTIETVRKLVEKRKETHVGEIGKDFHEAFLKALDEIQAKWHKKCDDPPVYASISDMPIEYNIEFHGLLERLYEHCFKACFEVSDKESDLIIGEPEDIAGHPIKRAKPQEASISPMSSFDKPLYPAKPTFTKEEAQEISDGIKKFREFEKEKAKTKR